MDKAQQQRFTVDLPIELHDALRQTAAQKRVRMRELVVSCLSECLSRPEAMTISRAAAPSSTPNPRS